MPSGNDREKRQSIINACLRMNMLGINQGTSGNISLRHDNGMLITPTSVPYEAMQTEQIVFMNLDGSVEPGQRPSSEWRFHLDIFKARPEINAVVHAHPPYATTLAIMGREIPAVHYMIAVAGGDTIRCAPYATFGTEELSRHAVRAQAHRLDLEQKRLPRARQEVVANWDMAVLTRRLEVSYREVLQEKRNA